MSFHINNATVAIGKKIICRSLSMALAPGTVMGILGPNGSGKTTLLHTFAGLHPLLHGEILLKRKNLSELSYKHIAQSIALLFQTYPETFASTVWEYCLGARFPHRRYFQQETDQDKQIAHSALQTMELTALVDKNRQQLSGGEKQRLALATILAQTPLLYLLDEPTNHLDLRHQTKTLRHFQQLAKHDDVIVIMSLHNIQQAQQFCDSLLLLFADGTTIQGCTQEVLTAENLTRLYQCAITNTHTEQGVFWYTTNTEE